MPCWDESINERLSPFAVSYPGLVFATNSDFLVPIFLQSDDKNL